MTQMAGPEFCLSFINFAEMLGEPPCWGDNRSRPYLLGKASYSGKDLPESYGQQIFASWLRYHAPMICSRANFNNSSRYLSLSISAMILTSRSNKSNSS